MNAVLLLLVLAVGVALCFIALQHVGLRKRLARYQQIQDAEAYLSSCEANAKASQEQCQKLGAQATSLNEQLAAQKNRIAQYQQLLGTFQSAAELHQRIERDTARVQQLAATIGKLDHAVKLNDYIRTQDGVIKQKQAELDSLSSVIGSARTVTDLVAQAKLHESYIAQKQAELDSLSGVIGSARSMTEIAAQAKYYENYLAQLKADVEAVEEAKSLQEFGFYRPRYNFDSSELYNQRLEQVRAQQKAMLKAKIACVCHTEWTVDGSKTEGRKMIGQQIKLMLRAFNGECDAAVSKVRYNNAVSLETRIRRSFEQINKLGESQRVSLTSDFCRLKFDELSLSHEYQQKKEDEKEEQRLIREQMREEEKATREIEEACEEADREESLKTQALERARAELAVTSGQQTAKLEALVSRLENELHEVLDKKAKAIARAQLTKSGHVYILSNIGAFGEGIYKIGMSRRLEPLDRVNELGGASVPFPFDVHAMIYSENAPELECSLHKHFASRRVNMINLRREFFKVTLDEIRAAVAEYFGQVTFVLEPEAEQYRQTTAMLKDVERGQAHLQIA